MYSKLFGRLPARQARRHVDHAKRQFGANGQLTAPITITQVVVVPARSSSSSIPASTTSALSQTTVSSSSLVSVIRSSSTIATPTVSPETSSVSSTSAFNTPSAKVMSEPQGDSKGQLQGDAGGKQNGLPPGAIAGIVIAVLLVLVALVVFLIRKRSIFNRQKRSASWKNNMFSKGISSEQLNGGGLGYMSEATRSGFGQPGTGSSGYLFAQTQTTSTKSIPRVPVPAMPTTTYNNPSTASLINPTPVSGSPQRSAMPVNGATVRSTFIPSLPDELSISMGEVIRVLAEYDDGWALCVNGRGEQGMVPLECLDQGNGAQQVYVAREPNLARRASSLTGSVRRI